MIKEIYIKELKDAFRDQKTLIVSVLMPVIMIVGITLFYEQMFLTQNQDEVNRVAVHENLPTDLFQRLDAEQRLELVRSEDPVQAAIDGEVRAALLIGEGMKQEDVDVTEVHIYADQSSRRSSDAVADLRSAFEMIRQDLVHERLAQVGVDPKLVHPFQIEIESLSGGEEMSIMLLSMLFSLAIVLSVMLGGYSAATDLFAGEKERQTMEALLMTPVSRSKVIIAKWLTISTLGALSGIFSILAFVLVTQTLTKNLAEVLNFGEQTWLIYFSAVIGIIAFALLFATIQMMISMLSKTFKEAQNYLTPVMFIAMIPYFLQIGVIPNEFTLAHYIVPFMNIHALLKELIYGVFSIKSILLVTGQLSADDNDLFLHRQLDVLQRQMGAW